MKHGRAIATTAFLIGAISFIMPTRPTLAHAGHSSSSENKVEQPAIKEQTDNKSQIPQKDDDSKPQNTSVKQETNITESEVVPPASPDSVSEPARADIVPIMGESLFVLLLASPLLLVALKRWMYK
ncbi:hypothetical protein [Myxosarcina sp. GI1]|uniref:hypothetical protein n=1 Tax=Myxosarcina sp. GI1 TaxID=1541065 RepID=UPI00055DBA5F|nr:hypothetical protein [Myxosarcina sp. GI1]